MRVGGVRLQRGCGEKATEYFVTHVLQITSDV
jgi:hypothetical protein